MLGEKEKLPYRWIINSQSGEERRALELCPHNSLTKRGFAGFIMTTFVLCLLPLLALSGTHVFWGVLPFLMLAVWAVWVALQNSYRRNNIYECLSFGKKTVDLKRTNPRGDTQKWSCDGYWSRTTIYAKEGPVPDYVTLTGNGREVEIGSFLSQDERKSLYEELQKELTNYKSINQRNH